MPGLNKSVVRSISQQKHEPPWMLDFRLRAYEVFKKAPLPRWGVDLSELDFQSITYFNPPEASRLRHWDQVPTHTKAVFEKLKIPEAERKVLAGVGAQWDSGIVYQSLKQDLAEKGVVFCDFDEAVKKYPRLVKKHFMTKCVNIQNNKFAALHGAVWSGGSFVFVPKGVKVNLPLQGYFWLNLLKGGQFEHTLIIVEDGGSLEFIEGCAAPTYQAQSLHAGVAEIFVGPHARVSYSTVQNWSRDVYNLSTKRAIVEKDGSIEWISGSLGSKKTMVYPASVLAGSGAKSQHLSLNLAGAGQELDTGGKVIHLAPATTSEITAKSVSHQGGQSTYRGLISILPGAKGAKSSVVCDSLILDSKSRASTHPVMEIFQDQVTALHEAKTGKISEEQLFYLMSRGLTEKAAMSLIITGFAKPLVKKLPLEYAVELNRLIDLEMSGSVG